MGAILLGNHVDKQGQKEGSHRPEIQTLLQKEYMRGWNNASLNEDNVRRAYFELIARQVMNGEKSVNQVREEIGMVAATASEPAPEDTAIIMMGDNGPELRGEKLRPIDTAVFRTPTVKEEDLVYPPADVMAQLKENVIKNVKLHSYGPVTDPLFPGTEILDGTPHPEYVEPYADSDVEFMNTVSGHPDFEDYEIPPNVKKMYFTPPPLTNSQGPKGLTLSELDNRILGLQGRDPEETVVVEEQLMFTEPPHHVLEKDLSHPLGSQPCCEGLGDAYR
jgi:hypothetical protein